MRTTKYAAPVIGLATALLVTACGGNDDTTGSDENGSGSEGDSTAESGDEPSGEPIIIGLNEDSTGPGASYSVIAGATIRDAVDEINANGGILGRPVELIVENDESDPTKAPSVVRKLIDDGAVALLLQSSSTAVNQAKPILQEEQVVALAPTSISQTFGEPPDNDYAYSLANLLSDFAEVYCGAFEAQGYERLAVLSDASATIDGVNGLLFPPLEECIEIVADERAPLDSADLSAQVARIADSDPDVVLVSSVGGNFEVLAHNTLAQQLPDPQRFSLASIGNQPDSWELANPGALEGMVYMGSISTENENTQQLQEWLSEVRGEEYIITAYDGQAYDSVQLIKMAIEEAGGTDDPVALKEAMDSIEGYEAHFGQSGFTLSYGPEKHLGADGLCGLVLTEFGPDNTPVGPWDAYQPPC